MKIDATCSIYLGGNKIIDYHAVKGEEDDHGEAVIRKTFMSKWTSFFSHFQVFYLIGVVSSLLVFSFLLFAQKVKLNMNAVYKRSVEDRMDEFSETHPPPTKNELAWLSVLFRAVIICVAPASLFIYRSRLVTLYAF